MAGVSQTLRKGRGMANPLESVWNEFKQAPPGGKALAITAVIAVAGIGLYVGHKNSSGSGSTSSSNVLPVDLSTVPDTGVPFANLPANPANSTGATGTTGGTASTGGSKGKKHPKLTKEGKQDIKEGKQDTISSLHGRLPAQPNLHPHATGIHSISSHKSGGTLLR